MSTHAFESDFEEAIAEALRRKGWSVHTQIGVSKFRIDLGIVHPDYPGRYLAGVECDGAAYHSSPSARDRDRVRHAILENLGWKLVRIWSTDYWIDPARTIDRVHQRLTELLEEERKKEREENAQKDRLIDESARTDQPEVLPEAAVLRVENFEAEDAGDKADNDNIGIITTILPQAVIETLSAQRFHEREYLPVIESIAGRLVDSLGPITFRHLSTKIARAHGFQRTGSQIKNQVWAAISKKRRSTRSPDGETIFWPENTETSEVVPFRGMKVNGEDRNWQDVPYPEKLGLAVSVLKEEQEDPVNTLAAQIGLGRLRQATKAELQKLLEEASGWLYDF